MLVMVGNHSSNAFHYWQGKYGGLGHLHSPGRAYTVFPWLTYALDNGAFSAWTNGIEWDELAFVDHCDRIKKVVQKPAWILVPDVVADKFQTIAKWYLWEERLRQYRCPLAFAVQDGMSASDVPSSADIVFVGGSTEWKLANLRSFCENFQRVHVGRVNSLKRLWLCYDAGAESVDGTGWFMEGWRNDPKGLEYYLRYNAGLLGQSCKQLSLW